MPEIRISERDFMAQVREYAELTGWLVYHTHDSRRSDKGFPDLVMVRDIIIFAELKRKGENMTREQSDWFDALKALYSCEVEVVLWRPQDWDEIEKTLARTKGCT